MKVKDFEKFYNSFYDKKINCILNDDGNLQNQMDFKINDNLFIELTDVNLYKKRFLQLIKNIDFKNIKLEFKKTT